MGNELVEIWCQNLKQNAMKKLTTLSTSMLISFLLMFLLQGCWWPSNYSNTYVDQSKVFKDRSYTDDKPFKMQDGTIQAPLMSQKNQLNATLDFSKGPCVSWAITKNLYVQGGFYYLNIEESSRKSTIVPAMTVTRDTYGNVDTTNTIKKVDYTLLSKLSVSSFYATFGHYKSFHKNGRFEYCAGFAHGSAKNNYTYNFSGLTNYSFSESRSYNQYFLQTDLGFVTKTTEGALILKVSCYNFYNRKFEKDFLVPEYEMKNTEFVLQPAMKFGFGGRFRFYLLCGWNIPLGDEQFQFLSSNVQAGITIRLHDKLWNN